MIAEISLQLGRKPVMIICSVGGGGLLGGVITGCKAIGWEDGKYGATPGPQSARADGN